MDNQAYTQKQIEEIFQEFMLTDRKIFSDKVDENKFEEKFVIIISYYENALKEMIASIKIETFELEKNKKTVTLISANMMAIKNLIATLYENTEFFDAYLYYISGLAKKNETTFNIYKLALDKGLPSDKELIEVITGDEQKIFDELIAKADADFEKSCQIAERLIIERKHAWVMRLVLIENYRARDKLEILNRYFVHRQKAYDFESSKKHIIRSIENLSKFPPVVFESKDDSGKAFCETADDRQDYLKELFELYGENSLTEMEKLLRHIRKIYQLPQKIRSFIDEKFFNDPFDDLINKTKSLMKKHGFIDEKAPKKFKGNKRGFLTDALALFDSIDSKLQELSEQCRRPNDGRAELLYSCMKATVVELKNLESTLDGCLIVKDEGSANIKKNIYKILYRLQAVLYRILAEFKQENIASGMKSKKEKQERDSFCEISESYLMKTFDLQRDKQNEIDRLINISDVWLDIYMVRHVQIQISDEHKKNAITAALESVRYYSSALGVLEKKSGKGGGFTVDEAAKNSFRYSDLLEKRFLMFFKLEKKCRLAEIVEIVEVLKGLGDKAIVLENALMEKCLNENLNKLEACVNQKQEAEKKNPRKKKPKKRTEQSDSQKTDKEGRSILPLTQFGSSTGQILNVIENEKQNDRTKTMAARLKWGDTFNKLKKNKERDVLFQRVKKLNEDVAQNDLLDSEEKECFFKEINKIIDDFRNKESVLSEDELAKIQADVVTPEGFCNTSSKEGKKKRKKGGVKEKDARPSVVVPLNRIDPIKEPKFDFRPPKNPIGNALTRNGIHSGAKKKLAKEPGSTQKTVLTALNAADVVISQHCKATCFSIEKDYPMVFDILKKFEERGSLAYIKGGLVRNALLRKKDTPYDIDLTTERSSRNLKKRLGEISEGFAQVGDARFCFKYSGKFYILEKTRVTDCDQWTIKLDPREKDGSENFIPIDITCDDKFLKGAKEVLVGENHRVRMPTSNENAFDFDLFYMDQDLNVISPVNGSIDRFKKHEPNLPVGGPGKAEEVFRNDPLRLWLYVRKSIYDGIGFDGDVVAAAKNLGHLIQEIAFGRIRAELKKIFSRGMAEANIDKLLELGLFESIFPELSSAMADDYFKRWFYDKLDTLFNVKAKNNFVCEKILALCLMPQANFNEERPLAVNTDRKIKLYPDEVAVDQVGNFLEEFKRDFSNNTQKTVF